MIQIHNGRFVICIPCYFNGFPTLVTEQEIHLWDNGNKFVKNLNVFLVLSVSQAETTQADLNPEKQAKHQFTVQPYVTFSQSQKNYLYISTGTNSVSVKDRLSLKLSITAADQNHRDLIKQITYMVRQAHHFSSISSIISNTSMKYFFPPKKPFCLSQVLSKGKIIVAERVNVTNQLITNVGLTVTPEMMPSFRFVAFYSIPWSGREEVVADSVWVDVADSCAGGVSDQPSLSGRWRSF